jgi:hypothetical protein
MFLTSYKHRIIISLKRFDSFGHIRVDNILDYCNQMDIPPNNSGSVSSVEASLKGPPVVNSRSILLIECHG